MRLLVTGSRDSFPGLLQALDAIFAAVEPDEIHVREQTGVDIDTREWAAVHGHSLVPTDADMSQPSPQRYHDANQRMVDKCEAGDVAVGFPGPNSRGTWDCLRRALKRGLKCYVADPSGRISRWYG